MASIVELKNPVKERMQAGDVSLGMIVRLARSGDIARIAKTTGHDFIFMDRPAFAVLARDHRPHRAGGARLRRGAAGAGAQLPTIPTPRSCSTMARPASSFPTSTPPPTRRRAVDACKFAPIGKRSVVGGYPMFDLRPVPLAESVRALNAATLVVCMIETVEGLANVEEIAAVDGVDVLHVGCNDLLHHDGQARRLRRSRDRGRDRARDRGRQGATANMPGSAASAISTRQHAFIRKGVRFVTTQTDIGFLMAAAGQRTASKFARS